MLNKKSDLLLGLLIVPALALVGLVGFFLQLEGWPFVVIGGAALTLYGAWRLREANQSLHWPAAVGTVVSAAIEDYLVQASKYVQHTYFIPVIEFTYAAQARQYSSGRTALDMKSVWNTDRRVIEEMLEKFAPGRQAPIYVNPRNPAIAVLIPGASSQRRSHYWALTVGGALLTAAGCGVYLLGRAG